MFDYVIKRIQLNNSLVSKMLSYKDQQDVETKLRNANTYRIMTRSRIITNKPKSIKSMTHNLLNTVQVIEQKRIENTSDTILMK